MPDVELSDFGSIVVLTPKTDAGRDWILRHVDTKEAQPWGDGIACERDYGLEIVLGMVEDGIEVE